MNKKYILGIAGSIRSNFKRIDVLEKYILESHSTSELADRIVSAPHKFANSEISLALALVSARQAGWETRLISISNIFERSDRSRENSRSYEERMSQVMDVDFLSLDDSALQDFYDLIKGATGIILSSPVYFGDRSSVANKFMQLTNKYKMLKDKVFGMIAVGAKRNGGQETTCIYGLYEALMQEAICVGNGPKTSQYGATVVAGDIHTALTDDWGMERCVELGKRIAHVSTIVSNGASFDRRRRLKILVLMTMDTVDKQYRRMVEAFLLPYAEKHDLKYVNLIDYDIFRCIACDICPSYSASGDSGDDNPYACFIRKKNDSLREIHGLLLNNDCIIIVGVNSGKELMYRYQAFTERTRYMRRDDFQLTNTTIVGFLINEVGSINSPLHNLRVLTSYIRHNTVFLKPIEIICHEDRIIWQTSFEEHIPSLQLLSHGRDNTTPFRVSYKATGYSDTRLDRTYSHRK
jgi:multimeric flavodoxin WrbA